VVITFLPHCTDLISKEISSVCFLYAEEFANVLPQIICACFFTMTNKALLHICLYSTQNKEICRKIELEHFQKRGRDIGYSPVRGISRKEFYNFCINSEEPEQIPKPAPAVYYA